MFNFKQWIIVSLDIIFLWYLPTFLNTASSFVNLLGVLLFITLLSLTIKFFKK